ncbi:AraC family transcriptional regulator [Streptomyces sp. NPDC096032]|uniref:AraC family transcriptional regulator n=1 Tax=Streptomyces sp. NPDC096032 TaxID=3366070 RepID=UPI00382C78C6
MEPFVRTAALTGYSDLCRTLRIQAEPLLARVGLDPCLLLEQDHWIPAHTAARLLELSAAASGREDFGLLLTDQRQLSTLGPICLALREEPDLRSVITTLIRHQSMYNEALRGGLTESAGLATLAVDLRIGTARQATELAVATYYRVLSAYLGSRWHPLGVHFSHTAPADSTTHHAVFGTVVEFTSSFNGCTLYAEDLDAPNAAANPQLLAYATHYVESLAAEPKATTRIDRVRALIDASLPTGRCTAEHIARSLNIDRRTLHRQLTASGTTFSSLLETSRSHMAKRLVANPAHSFTDVAALLGFASPSTFSRWFREHFSCSPRDWRARHGT